MDVYNDEDLCLERLRSNIDKIDEQIVRLLNDRFSCCLEIANLKKRLKLSLIDFKRQREVLDRVAAFSSSRFADLNELVFSTIMVLSSAGQLEHSAKFF